MIKEENGSRYYVKEVKENMLYEEEMLKNISDENALNPKVIYDSKKRYYYYNISKYISLKEYVEKNRLCFEKMLSVFIQMKNLTENLKKYMLSEKNLEYTGESIFIDEFRFCLKLPLLPEKYGGKKEKIKELAELLLKNADNSDTDSLRLAFSIFQKTLDRDFSVLSFINIADEFRENRHSEDKINKREEKTMFEDAVSFSEKESLLTVPYEDTEKKTEDNRNAAEEDEEEDERQIILKIKKYAAELGNDRIPLKLLIIFGIMAAGIITVFFFCGVQVMLRYLPIFFILALAISAYFIAKKIYR